MEQLVLLLLSSPEPAPAPPVLAPKRKAAPRQTPHPLGNINPATLRQAIIWREILGPPRSLQSH